MPQALEFALSRIYALGWSAARQGLAAEAGPPVRESGSGEGAALNPYPADPERARWDDGFKAGMRGWRGRTRGAGRFGQR